MIATVASSSIQYHHTVNTLKYADRAKEIKTHVRQNAGTVQEHIAQYQAIIDDLKEENDQLKRELNTVQVMHVHAQCWYWCYLLCTILHFLSCYMLAAGS